MKLPRNISGQELVKILTQLGYEKVQQKGSHIKLNFKTSSQSFWQNKRRNNRIIILGYRL